MKCGMDWRGLERTGEDWRGLDRTGEDWRGLERNEHSATVVTR